MNYAMQMMETYTEMLNTSEFAKEWQTTLIKNTTRITHIRISANVFQSRQKRILPL